MSLRRRVIVGLASLAALSLVGVATSPAVSARPAHAAAASHKNLDPVIYDSTVQPNPGNLSSESYEASGVGEFGNQISFGGTARVLDNVTVQMSSWGCVDGNWSTYNTAPCVTPPGSTFAVPITFNIYNVGPASAYGPSTAGSLIASVQQTFNIPYRPSADTNYATDCLPEATANSEPISDFAGTWYDAALNKCFNGFLTPITFTFGHVQLPANVIYGVAFNTSDQGAQPQRPQPCNSTSGGCGYDSLNVAVSQEPTAPSVGTDTYPGTTYINVTNSQYAYGNYCDHGGPGATAPSTPGTNIDVFRIDEPANWPTGDGTTSGCWSVSSPGPPYFVPAVQFNAVPSPHAIITSANTATVAAGVPFSFTVTSDGVPTPVITVRGRMPVGLAFQDLGNGSGVIFGTAAATNRNKTYHLTIRATNLPLGGRNRQSFSLVLTGGRG